MFSSLRGWEWIIILAIVLLLFGSKRLPDAARALGRSMRILKSETKAMKAEGNEPPAPAAETGTQDPAAPGQGQPVAQQPPAPVPPRAIEPSNVTRADERDQVRSQPQQ